MSFSLPFRQVHLDFHTSPVIPEIGVEFDKKHWQETLRRARVDSITVFSKCHHGWSYHPTVVGKMHPHLSLDLLSAQIEASREIGVNTPIYLSAGIDNLISAEHPEWREMGPDGAYTGWVRSVIQPGFHKMCFNSPYLDYLCWQIREAVELFPGAHGVFLDIIAQGECCCRYCLESMERNGLDAERPEDRRRNAQWVLERYYQMTTDACRWKDADMRVFHNSGHIARGQRSILKYFSHLELESLPTGGWGYDHFPVSAKYVSQLGMEFLGMTGKFHSSWGEFGGYKHPNALRYECAAMIAYGARCSVGDQLHPNGKLDESTYDIIGAAYQEVEAKEAWCVDAVNIAEVALLSVSSLKGGHHRDDAPDVGASRVLLEGGFLFDVLDQEMDFHPYKLIVVPDEAAIDAGLQAKLANYLSNGGRLLLSGRSGLNADGSGFLFDAGAEVSGQSPFSPDYVLPIESLRAEFLNAPLVMYLRGYRLKVTDGESLGAVFDPYFNRTFRHFCSHQHTPPQPRPSEYHMGVRKGGITYLAHPWFSIYRSMGAVAYRQILQRVVRFALGSRPMVETNLPSTARVTLTEQREHKRRILHLLNIHTIYRGGPVTLVGGAADPNMKGFEIIEETTPVHDVSVSVEASGPVAAVLLEPQGEKLSFTEDSGRVQFRIPRVDHHQMVAIHGSE